MPDAPEGTTAVVRHQTLGGVLDDDQSVPLRDVHDRVHLARDPGVVDRDDGLRARSDRRLDQPLIDVEGIGSDVDEDGRRSA